MRHFMLNTLSENLFLSLHIGTIIIAHTLFVLAFGVGLLLILKSGWLKQKKLFSAGSYFPSLKLLDQLNLLLLATGFSLLVIGMISGVLLAIFADISLTARDTRFLGSMITLLIYSLFFVLHLLRGIRGKSAAWVSVFGFLSAVVSLLGINLFGASFHVY